MSLKRGILGEGDFHQSRTNTERVVSSERISFFGRSGGIEVDSKRLYKHVIYELIIDIQPTSPGTGTRVVKPSGSVLMYSGP